MEAEIVNGLLTNQLRLAWCWQIDTFNTVAGGEIWLVTEHRLMTDGHNEKAQCQSHFASFQKDTSTFFLLRGQPSGRFHSSAAFLFIQP